MSAIPRYPTSMDVIALNERVLGQPGGLVDAGKLAGALHRAQAVAHYAGADEVRQSVVLLVGVALAHAFVDGNKRTALAAVAVFWGLNSWTFTGDYLALAQRLERLIARNEARETEAEELEAWLRAQLVVG
ncbi:MAG: type II toxin-antitoxin system death-on-curing family toxin [Thermomicrobiales bacterium]